MKISKISRNNLKFFLDIPFLSFTMSRRNLCGIGTPIWRSVFAVPLKTCLDETSSMLVWREQECSIDWNGQIKVDCASLMNKPAAWGDQSILFLKIAIWSKPTKCKQWTLSEAPHFIWFNSILFTAFHCWKLELPQTISEWVFFLFHRLFHELQYFIWFCSVYRIFFRRLLPISTRYSSKNGIPYIVATDVHTEIFGRWKNASVYIPFSASHAPSFLLLQFERVVWLLLLVLCENIAAFIPWARRDPSTMVDVLIGTYHLLCIRWQCRRDFGQLGEHLCRGVYLNDFVWIERRCELSIYYFLIVFYFFFFWFLVSVQSMTKNKFHLMYECAALCSAQIEFDRIFFFLSRPKNNMTHFW